MLSWQVAYRGQLPDEFLDTLDVEKRAKMWFEVVQEPDKAVFVSDEKDGTIVGFSVLRPSRDTDALPGTAEIGAIYVHPDKWQRGIGRALLSTALEQARDRGFDDVTLWVFEKNGRARSFYELFGFVQDGAVRDQDRGQCMVRSVRYRRDLRTKAG